MKSFMVSVFVLSFVVLGSYSASFAAADISLVGADPGPNESGEIPAWVGIAGLQCPADYEKGDFLPNPYEAEKPLYRIDHTNVDKYKHRLSFGQVTRLKRHKRFYMNIYPAHRNLEYLPEYYAATIETQKSVKIDEDNTLIGFKGGVAFPHAKNGLEAAWNVRRMYTSDDAMSSLVDRIVSPAGKIKKTIQIAKVMTLGEGRITHKLPNPNKLAQKIVAFYTYPADTAGTCFMAYSYLDSTKLDETWLYLPTLRRVRRAPSMTGGGQIDGELCMDENGQEFRGNVNDWTWKLHGKKEHYVAYNCFSIFVKGTKPEDECWAQDLNPERLRYELHRVYKLEANAIEGLNHPYKKRVGFYDEDAWQPLLGDRYDKRGDIYRQFEAYTYADYCEKMRQTMGYLYMNLVSGRYELFGGNLDENSQANMYNIGMEESFFTVQNMRRLGR